MTTPIRALLFDMDGLLLDTETIHINAYVELTARLGKPQTAQSLVRFIGHSHLVSCKWLIEELGCEGTIDGLIEQELAIYYRMLKEERPAPLPGVAAMFDSGDARGLKRALVSSSAGPQVDPTMQIVIEHLGRAGHWKEHFQSIATGEMVAKRKPAPDLYQLAVKNLGLAPEQCVAFEDSAAGVSAAHAAGVRVAAVPNSYLNAADVTQGKADYEFATLADAHASLDRLLSGK
jgi:beta-phosphoglucomutase-like phosphatase (HAD superfamily)